MEDRELGTIQGSAVSLSGRGLLILGPPGSGKTSLALALIDRGASLIGDDGVTLAEKGSCLIAAPPPNIAGKIEIGNVGIVEMPYCSAPLALILQIAPDAPRYCDQADQYDLHGHSVPCLKFHTGDAIQAIRAEWAMQIYGSTTGLPNASQSYT